MTGTHHTEAAAVGTARRRVAFEGAEVIEYDAELAPVVRLCGVAGSAAVALECEARGLAAEADAAETLRRQHVRELQLSLRQRGFEPMGDELQLLQKQRRVADLLLVWASGADAPAGREQGKQHQRGDDEPLDVLDPATLRRAQLAKKQLQGLVDDGYAFGRRFLSVAAYVDSLDGAELLLVAKERGIAPPKLDDKQRKEVKALDRELLGRYGTAEGRPLRTLTLRQLVTEAEARGVLGPGGEKARDSKGKKSKRAWVDLLRPIMVAEVRAAKICEQEEDLLRELLVRELEQEKQKEQHQCVIGLIEAVIKQSSKGSGPDCAEPEDDDATLDQEDNQDTCNGSKLSDKDRNFLEVLVKTVCIHSEGQEDVVMRE
ncbi:unnamed protein product [Phytophthora fragariaefolia]|uniref:Unnamed protein product n=1 Tax=Phytophthora fragariaefolia TaxID=1490495 RepID=A0A9W6WVX0_9STRA|nr:unnamed protein product [Phytophthora fragariaefolia]